VLLAIIVVIYTTITLIICICGGEFIFEELDGLNVVQLLLYYGAAIAQVVAIFLLAASHSNQLSLYPLNDVIFNGPMIKVANVDLDLESDNATTGTSNQLEDEPFEVVIEASANSAEPAVTVSDTSSNAMPTQEVKGNESADAPKASQ